MEVEVLVEVPVYVEKIVEEDVIVETQMDNFSTQQGYDMSSIDVDDQKFTVEIQERKKELERQ